VFWQVAVHAGPQQSEAVVHVVEQDVDVIIDDSVYEIERLRTTPIIHPVVAGPHILRMLRDGRVLYEERFVVERGEDIVLTAWLAPSR
jgi:hypothetical protein